jgi:phytoene dehydrogenase-like protein
MGEHHQVVVVGAGLAGLTAARYLQSAGIDVVVLEASDRVGGRVTSDLIDGFILDRGFQVINPAYPEIVALNLLQGLNFSAITPAIRISREVGDLIVGDPRRHPGFLPALLSSRSGTLGQKLRFLRFLLRKQDTLQAFGSASEDFADFAAAVLNPFLRGVFLADPDLVSARVAQEIIAYFAKATPGVPKSGVAAFSQTLAQPVVNLRFNEVVQEVSPGKIRTDRGELTADQVIVAVDPTTATQLLGITNAPRVSSSTTWYHSTAEEIAYSKYLVVDPLAPIANSIVVSDVAPSYAPAGLNLIATTTLEPISESEVRRWMAKMWSADTRSWDLVATYNIKQSLPLQTTYPAQDFKLGDGLYLVGDHRSLPSQQGAMFSGRVAAQDIIRSITPKH